MIVSVGLNYPPGRWVYKRRLTMWVRIPGRQGDGGRGAVDGTGTGAGRGRFSPKTTARGVFSYGEARGQPSQERPTNNLISEEKYPQKCYLVI